MSTFDAATATLIAAKYLRQHLNTIALSYLEIMERSQLRGTNRHMHSQTGTPAKLHSHLFLKYDIYWAQQRWLAVLPLQQGAGQGHQGLLVPRAHQNVLCAGGAALLWKVSTACDKLFQKLPSMFCTHIESGLFRAGKKCSSGPEMKLLD